MLGKCVASVGWGGARREQPGENPEPSQRWQRAGSDNVWNVSAAAIFILKQQLQSQFSKSKPGDRKGVVKVYFLVSAWYFETIKTSSEQNVLPVTEACCGRAAVAVSPWVCFPTWPFSPPALSSPPLPVPDCSPGWGPAPALWKSCASSLDFSGVSPDLLWHNWACNLALK